VQVVHASLLDRVDMDEDVIAAPVRVMNSYPLVSLNHFTVPVVMASLLSGANPVAGFCNLANTNWVHTAPEIVLALTERGGEGSAKHAALAASVSGASHGSAGSKSRRRPRWAIHQGDDRSSWGFGAGMAPGLGTVSPNEDAAHRHCDHH